MFEDLTALEPKTAFSRREFVVTTLATGFAMAVQPVSAPPAAIQGVKPAPGAESRYMVTAERFAKANGCPTPAAAMILKAPFNESFSVTCGNGSTILVRCENDACRSL